MGLGYTCNAKQTAGGGGPFFMTTVTGELYAQEEDPFAEVSEDEEEDSFEKVPQVAKQNSLKEICQRDRQDCVPKICQGTGSGKGKARCPNMP